MVNSGKELCETLNIAYDERLEPYFEKGRDLYLRRGDFVVDKDRIIRFNEKYKFIRSRLSTILEAADLVREDENLMLFVYTLVAIYDAGLTPTYWEVDHNVTMMGIPDRERLDTDMAPIFSAFYFLERAVEEYERRGLPFEVISDTLHGMEKEMDDYETMIGRVGMRRYVGWYSNWVNMCLITVGRFQFKTLKFYQPVRVYRKGDDIKILMDGEYMHKKGMVFGSAGQDDEDGKFYAEIREEGDRVIGYAANELGECDPTPVELVGYREILRKGDMVLDVHIPADLPLDPETCNASYKNAWEILNKAYPEHGFKGIVCKSWMLEKRLLGIMGKETNVTRFQDAYHGFPVKSNGDAIYSFIFKIPAPLPVAELPENSSMQRAVKKYLSEGNYFYEKGGFMPMD